MPSGRSLVTLQGPSLARRSASARRRRTESSVQASLRMMARVQGFGFGVGNEGHGYARGMGTRHQRYHEDGAFHYHDCSRYRSLTVWMARFVSGVKFAADQGDQGHQVHPDQQRDAGADRAVHHVVTRHVAHVPGESRGGQQPQERGQHRARPDQAPALLAVGAEVVKRRGDHDGGRRRPAM